MAIHALPLLPPVLTTVSEADRHAALDRLRLHLRTEYARDVQRKVLLECGPRLFGVGNHVVLLHWLVKDGLVSLVDPDALSPMETAVSTEFSEREMDEFVRVFNEHLIKDGRITTVNFYAVAQGWVFQIAAAYARAVFAFCNQ